MHIEIHLGNNDSEYNQETMKLNTIHICILNRIARRSMNLSRASDPFENRAPTRYSRKALIRLRLTVNAVCSQRWGSLRGSTSCLTR